MKAINQTDEATAETRESKCEWSLVFGDAKAYWQTTCGKQAWFSEYRHPQNEAYCCYCGKLLAIGQPVITDKKARKLAAIQEKP